MKSAKSIFLSLTVSSLLLTSCATIVGGSKYNAHIVVSDNSNAKIVYKGEVIGTGSATVKVKRKEANKFEFIVRQDGCNEQNYKYSSRTFRGWAFALTILGWTGAIGGVPLPWGVVTDLATGAVWKPNVMEKGVSKEDYKNFKYLVSYTNCPQNNNNNSNGGQLLDVVYLKNGSIIRGQIIEQVPGVTIKLQTKDGNVFVYKIDDIEKMTREQVK
jgi:hypothetical protein